MSKILISTIMRNCDNNLGKYFSSIKKLIDNSDDEFYVSIYENDSIDGTKEILNTINDSRYNIKMENIGTLMYNSISCEDRVKNLSLARNKTLDVEWLNIVDYVLCYEVDVNCDLSVVLKLLEHREYDIVSPMSMRKNGSLVYDAWATRLTDSCVNELKIRDSGLYTSRAIIPVWSTFNLVCLYNANPFKKGVRFGYYNDRLKTWDCDTVVICEKFRECGYNNIVLDTRLVVSE